jgi:hypothetical protein
MILKNGEGLAASGGASVESHDRRAPASPCTWRSSTWSGAIVRSCVHLLNADKLRSGRLGQMGRMALQRGASEGTEI